MKYILENDGNRERFRALLREKIRCPDRQFSMTVNVWRRPRRWYHVKNNPLIQDSYDAAFFCGEYKSIGDRSPVEARANFRDKRWKKEVAYRIRVYPHPSTKGDRPPPPRR